MKFFETSNDIAELIQDKFEETSLGTMGINLKILSVPKAKTALKVKKASPEAHYLTNKDIILLVYEDAFDRLTDGFKHELIEGAISNVSYDTEKDKLNVDGDVAKEIFRMRKKYDNYVDVMETSYIIIEEIEEEERQRKEAEKLRKAEERAAKKRNNND